MEAMLNYNWPGNIRELKNCLDRMMALNTGPLLHFMDLPTSVVNHARGGATDVTAAHAAVGTWNAPGATTAISGSVLPLHVVERREIENALRQTKGDRTEAAMLLGIGRTTLYRKLKEYGVPANC